MIGLIAAAYFRNSTRRGLGSGSTSKCLFLPFRISLLKHKSLSLRKSLRSNALYVLGTDLAIVLIVLVGKLAAARRSLRPVAVFVKTVASAVRRGKESLFSDQLSSGLVLFLGHCLSSGRSRSWYPALVEIRGGGQ